MKAIKGSLVLEMKDEKERKGREREGKRGEERKGEESELDRCMNG